MESSSIDNARKDSDVRASQEDNEEQSAPD